MTITSESCSSTGHQGGAPDVLDVTFSVVELTLAALFILLVVTPS